jgi:hypothetical protein
VGRFLTPEPLPQRLLFAEPLRRRMRVKLGGEARTTQHHDLGETTWFSASAGDRSAEHAAWQHTALPDHASMLQGRVPLAWRAMDAFYEEDERIVGHAADAYHRIDIRRTSRHLSSNSIIG